MLADGKPWIKIRALEYAVDIDDQGRNVDGDQDLDRQMEMFGGVMAPEQPSASGKGKIVSVLIWRKRS